MTSVKKRIQREFKVPRLGQGLNLPSKNARTRRILLTRVVLCMTKEHRYSPRRLYKYLLFQIPQPDYPAIAKFKSGNRLIHVMSFQDNSGSTRKPQGQSVLARGNLVTTIKVPRGGSAKVVMTALLLEEIKKQVRENQIKFETKCPTLATKALHWGVQFEQADLVKRMLECGARVNGTNLEGWTPLQEAMYNKAGIRMNGNVRVVRKGRENGTGRCTCRGRQHHVFPRIPNVNLNNDVVKLLLETGADFNMTDHHGWTLLHHAIQGELDDIVQWLLEHKVKVNVVTDDGDTPLSMAAGLAKKDLVESLLGLRAEVNLAKRDKHALIVALRRRVGAFATRNEEDRQNVAMLLISQGADINFQDSKTGCTVLELALKQDQAMVALELINRGADISQPVKGSSLLHLAIAMKTSEDKCLEIINLLFSQGYDVKVKPLDSLNRSPLHLSTNANFCKVSALLINQGFSVNAPDEHGITPLDNGVTKRNVKLVKLLLDVGAHANGNKGEFMRTPLHLALDGGNLSFDIIKLLLEHGATNSCINIAGTVLSVLDRAISNKNVELVLLLRSHGFRYRAESLIEACETLQVGLAKYLIETNCTSKISTALYQVVLRIRDCRDIDKLERLKRISFLLLENGADVNHRFSKYDNGERPGWTILEHLVAKGKTDFAMYFISRGADIFSTHQNHHHSNQTLIHMIAENSSSQPPMDLVRCLCQRGINIKQPNSNGQTPLHMAASRGYFELVKYLVLEGTSVNARDRRGNTPLHFAVKIKSNVDVVKFLLQNGADQVRNRSGKTPAFFMCKNNDFSYAHLLVVNKGQTDYGLIRDAQRPVVYSGLYYEAKRGFAEVEKHDQISLQEKQELFKVAAMREDMETLKAIKTCTPINPKNLADALLSLMRIDDILGSDHRRPRIEEELVKNISLSMMQRIVDGSTILSQACLHNRARLVKIILKYHSPELLVTLGTPSPVWIAANEGLKDILEELLKHCKNPEEELTRQGPDGTTPLIRAVARKHESVMEVFKKHCNNELVLHTLFELWSPFSCPDFGLGTLKSPIRTGEESENFEHLKIPASLNMLPFKYDKTTSYLTLLSKQYPVFNEEIDSYDFEDTKSRNKEKQDKVNDYKREQSKKASNSRPDLSMGQGQALRFNGQKKGYIALIDPQVPSNYLDLTKDIKSNVLEPFCCLKTAIKIDSEMLELSKLIGYLHRCKDNCIQKEECEKVSALLTACHLLENEMNREEIKILEPTFILIGSVAEGTRLERANEIDLTVRFQNLEKYPLESSKYNLDLYIPSGSPMLRFSKNNCIYDHAAFLSYFMDTVKKGLVRASTSPKWPESLSCNLNEWKPCPECLKITSDKRTSLYHPQFHCKDCLPAVTHTKVGPCLVFQWRERITVTADLVPVFPVQSPGGGILGLFNTVTHSLLRKKPENWVDHFKSIIERDSILPESLGNALSTSGNNTVHEVAIKLLNYNPEDNCVIRPGQRLSTLDLRRHGSLREVYTTIKVIREIFQVVTVKSYVIKKVMFSPDIKAKLEDKNINTMEGAFVVLSHAKLKDHFPEIDFKKWEDNNRIMHKSHTWDRDNQIPIKDKAWTFD